MKGLPSAETAAYSDICEDFEQRMGNPQWKGFPQICRHSRINQSFLNSVAHKYPRRLANSALVMLFNLPGRVPNTSLT